MSISSTVTAIGFWVGALLPFVYLPVFLTGVDSLSRLLLFFTLVAINVFALYVGHDYPGTRER